MSVLDLSKKFELNLQKVGFTQIPTMQTRLAVDKSGSMGGLYRSGFVEKTIELFLGAAAKFDDNGELEYTFFNTGASSIKSVGVNDYKKLSIPDVNGGTNYVPALEELIETTPKAAGIFGSIFGKKDAKPADPVYVGFITDGDPNDLQETVKLLKSIEDTRNFIQFIIIGTDVSQRTQQALTGFKNVSVKIIANPSNMSVDDLYDVIANKELLAWYQGL